MAAILSVVESCRRLRIPVRDYLAEVLPGLADRAASEVGVLTPMAWQRRRLEWPERPGGRKAGVGKLSITHKSSTDEDAKFDVIESRHTAPHDRVSRWGIFGPGQVASQPGNFGETRTKRCRLALVACAVRYQTIRHAGFKLR